jgi:hypothetical protein
MILFDPLRLREHRSCRGFFRSGPVRANANVLPPGRWGHTRPRPPRTRRGYVRTNTRGGSASDSHCQQQAVRWATSGQKGSRLTNRNHGRVLLLQREATGEERRPLGAARAGWQLASDVVERGVVGRAGGYVTARADSEAPLRARAVAASLPVAVRVAALCGSLPTAWMRTQDGAPHRRPL